MLKLGQIAARVFVWQRVNHAVFLARNILLARYIMPEQQGVFATAFNLTLYSTILTTYDFRAALLTYKDPPPRLWNAQWSIEFLLGIAGLLIGLGALPFLVAGRGWPVGAAFIGLLAAGLIESTVSSRIYHAEKAMRFPLLTTMQTAVNLLSFMVGLGLAMHGWGWKAMVADRLVSSILIATLMLHFGRISVRFELPGPELRYLWDFVKVLFPKGAFCRVALGVDLYVVGRFLGEAPAGIYQMALKWAAIPMEIGGGFLAVMALSWYSAHAHEGEEALRHSYRQITFHLVRFCSGVAVLLALFLPDLFRLLYTREWAPVPQLYLMLLPYAVLRAVLQNGFQVFLAIKDTMAAFWGSLLHAATACLLVFIGVRWQLEGVAIGASVALAASVVWMELRIRRKLVIRTRDLHAAPLLLAAATGTVVFLIERSPLPELPRAIIRLLLATAYAIISISEWRRHRPSVA